jgi:hypothetical protein
MRAIKTGDQSKKLKKVISRDQSGTPCQALSLESRLLYIGSREQRKGV